MTHYAIKNKKKLVHAYRLGYGSAMEQLLLQEGAIRRLPDGSYELFSKEAVQGRGEHALRGDYFKVDTVEGRYYPYPNTREFFESNHTLVDAAQDLYEQQPKPLQVWQKEDEMCCFTPNGCSSARQIQSTIFRQSSSVRPSVPLTRGLWYFTMCSAVRRAP